MTKYNAFIQFVETENNPDIEHQSAFWGYFNNFEIAWESGQFDETPKGECCK